MRGFQDLDTQLRVGVAGLLTAWERESGVADGKLAIDAALLVGSTGITWGWAEGPLGIAMPPYMRLEGLSDLVNTIKQVHANLNRRLEIIGILRVMFDPRMTLSQQVSAQLEQHFGDKVFKTIIPRNVRLAEAPSYGMPGVSFDPSSKGAQAYVAFGAEMVERIKSW